jgi:3-dehydroquinate synthase
VAIKAAVVSEDDKDTMGRRILLNYGHTIGHALEAATGYRQYLHGEAVSIGMMGAGQISVGMGLASRDLILRQERLFRRFKLPIMAQNVDPDQVFRAMSMDKKIEEGAIRWVLLEDVGRAVVRKDVPRDLVENTVRALCQSPVTSLSTPS